MEISWQYHDLKPCTIARFTGLANRKAGDAQDLPGFFVPWRLSCSSVFFIGNVLFTSISCDRETSDDISKQMYPLIFS